MKGYKHGEPLLMRLGRHTLIGDGCWAWTGAKKTGGYGNMWWNGKMRMAHRMWYEALRGRIPEGLVIDHLCQQESCVNPWHLEAVTQAVNVRRGYGILPRPEYPTGIEREERQVA